MVDTLRLIHIAAAVILFATLVIRAVLLKVILSDRTGKRLSLVRVVRALSPLMGAAAGILLLAGIATGYWGGFSFTAPWLLTKEFITLLIFLLTFMGSSPATRQLSQEAAKLTGGQILSEDLRNLAEALYQLTLFVALMVVINAVVAYNKF